ncbi:hypothetical protein A3D79_02235 [Candidatus Daviesbacteria bacterium RIFCSPHIGHO2_02_FULL_39_8]|nr:MAG: hypothetical protein A3D79_02235 [Candidatus Daviesbacteria bacterium RIFCSPHIGHO2_02_FULL_39_8]
MILLTKACFNARNVAAKLLEKKSQRLIREMVRFITGSTTAAPILNPVPRKVVLEKRLLINRSLIY